MTHPAESQEIIKELKQLRKDIRRIEERLFLSEEDEKALEQAENDYRTGKTTLLKDMI